MTTSPLDRSETDRTPHESGSQNMQARRYKIVRGSIRKIGRIVAVYVGLTVGLLVSTLAAFSALRVHGGPPPALLPVLMASLLAGLLVYVNLPGSLDIGADGLMIDSRDERRYVAFESLEGASVFRESAAGKKFTGVELRMWSGEVFRVQMGEDHFGTGAKTAKLRDDIDAALREYREREPRAEVALPERGDESAKAWLDRLRAVGAGASAGPREAPIPAERLWRIVEDPRAEPRARAGAAAALSYGIDEGGRSRLRIAAAETASPDLRGVLESAAAEDEAELVRALDRVAEPPEREP